MIQKAELAPEIKKLREFELSAVDKLLLWITWHLERCFRGWTMRHCR